MELACEKIGPSLIHRTKSKQINYQGRLMKIMLVFHIVVICALYQIKL